MQNKAISFKLMTGHIIECFDNTLYGFFAVLLAPIFFPNTSEHLQIFASFIAFATGFIGRPLGALFFGWFGDKYGRTKPLYWSLICVSFPTIAIGLTPSYASIGITAPIILITMRFLQGFFWGGEYSGINLYVAESTGPNKRGTAGGTLITFGIMGAIVAALLAAWVSSGQLPPWAWRIPFICGGLLALSAFFIRRTLMETTVFQQEKSQPFSPFKTIIKNHKIAFLTVIVLSGLDLMPTYFAGIWASSFYQNAGFSMSQGFLCNAFSFAILALSVFVSGKIADKIGIFKQLTRTALLIALSAPFLFCLVDKPTLTLSNVFPFIVILACINGFISSVYAQYLAFLFPVKCRYTAMAFGITLGQALFGGTVPLIGLTLTTLFNSKIAPGVWLSLIALLACGLMHLENKRKQE